MRSILQSLIRFVVRHLLAFFLVVAVLLAGKWALAEFNAFRTVKSDLATLEDGREGIDAYRAEMANDVTTRITGFRDASIARIDERIASINQSIAQKANAQEVPLLSFPLPKGSQLAQGMVARSRRAVEIELLTQERDYLQHLRASLDAELSLKDALEKLEQLRLENVKATETLRASKRLLDQVEQESPFRIRLPGTFEHRKFEVLTKRYKKLVADKARANRAFQEQKKIVSTLEIPQRLAAFKVNDTQVDAALKPLHDSIGQGKAFIARNWVSKASGPVMEVVPTAAFLVLLMFLVPVGIKVFFYFVLAPLASRLQAIFVDRNVSGSMVLPDAPGMAESDVPRISGVSQPVTISEGDELLIHSEYIQSLSISGKKDTKWIMDWSCPFTSMAAGLVAMTRVRSDRAERVVISATDDPLSEIAVVSLPAGAAMVFQPRALVGVLYRKDKPLTITRHWRLGSLHAWLTLQLRYLVFRGPVTLIVKGCRGVRAESAGKGRSISQSATLGFSANIAYSTVRTETFFPYLVNKQALFNDRFEGRSGFYIYEETPRAGQKSGMLGRGIEGLTDAVLKVFGI